MQLLIEEGSWKLRMTEQNSNLGLKIYGDVWSK
jgi:hypothetical protein